MASDFVRTLRNAEDLEKRRDVGASRRREDLGPATNAADTRNLDLGPESIPRRRTRRE